MKANKPTALFAFAVSLLEAQRTRSTSQKPSALRRCGEPSLHKKRGPNAERRREEVNFRWYRIALALFVVALLVGCGGSGGDEAAQGTAIAAAIEGTLTAQAPSPTVAAVTVVVTPPPPPSPTPLPPTAVATAPPLPTEVPPPPAQSRIDLKADGSGDYATLEEALAQAPEGAEIHLDGGVYSLAAPVTVHKSLSLYGEPYGTVIVSDAAEQVLKFEGPGQFVVDGIIFRHEGSAAANVVVVLGGQIAFSACTFQGGVFDKEANYGGNGLFLGRDTQGQVYDCEATKNQAEGILLREQAQVEIARSYLHHNEDCGLGYFGQSGGTAAANSLFHNSYGICLMDTAAPGLTANISRFNAISGLAYFGQARGEARENDCSFNEYSGILVQGQAQPTLVGNQCFANGEIDIAYYESGGGSAQGNLCSTDAPEGLYVAESASPALSDNLCPLAGAAVQAGGSQVAPPSYNPIFLQGHGPICFNRPAPAVDAEWQTSAGTRSVSPGGSVELALRNKWGEPGESYPITVRVINPDGQETSAETTLAGDEDAILIYPDDFGGATDLQGAYTVIWEIEGGFVACDGFVMAGGAGW